MPDDRNTGMEVTAEIIQDFNHRVLGIPCGDILIVLSLSCLIYTHCLFALASAFQSTAWRLPNRACNVLVCTFAQTISLVGNN